jgi:hypothetical protein
VSGGTPGDDVGTRGGSLNEKPGAGAVTTVGVSPGGGGVAVAEAPAGADVVVVVLEGLLPDGGPVAGDGALDANGTSDDVALCGGAAHGCQKFSWVWTGSCGRPNTARIITPLISVNNPHKRC